MSGSCAWASVPGLRDSCSGRVSGPRSRSDRMRLPLVGGSGRGFLPTDALPAHPPMSEAARRTLEIEELAARLRRVEDELAIRRVILTYGPAADAGEAERAGALWADDGKYDWDSELPALEGPAAVAAMLQGKGHQSLIASGVAHFA